MFDQLESIAGNVVALTARVRRDTATVVTAASTITTAPWPQAVGTSPTTLAAAPAGTVGTLNDSWTAT